MPTGRKTSTQSINPGRGKSMPAGTRSSLKCVENSRSYGCEGKLLSLWEFLSTVFNILDLLVHQATEGLLHVTQNGHSFLRL